MATLLVSAMSLGGPGLRANLPENGLVLWQTIASESATVVLLQSSMVWNTVYGRRFINVSGPVAAPADSELCSPPSRELAGHILQRHLATEQTNKARIEPWNIKFD